MVGRVTELRTRHSVGLPAAPRARPLVPGILAREPLNGVPSRAVSWPPETRTPSFAVGRAMQTPTTIQQAPAQQAPAPPPGPAAPIVAGTPQPIAGPLTRHEVAAIRARREELSDQLQSAASRRNRLAGELRTADMAARPGLEQRIAVLDQRIVQLERDIAETGQQLTSAPAGLVATSAPPAGGFRGLSSDQVTAVSIVFTVLVLFPIAFAFARLLWKRATAPIRPTLPAEASQRLERLEQAVDTVAVEMERVSEGQRFMTRLLMEPNALVAIEAGRLAPDAPPPREREPVRVTHEGA